MKRTLALVFALVCSNGTAATVCVRWDTPSQYTNGKTLELKDLAGVRIMWTRTNSIFNGSQVSNTLVKRTLHRKCMNFKYTGDYEFYAKTVLTNGVESDWSAPVKWKL